MPRFLRVGASGWLFVPLEDVMKANLDLLFPGMEIESCAMFRVTRNAITEQDEHEADDLLELIEIELRERKFAPVVRLQVDRIMTPLHRGKLAAELGLDEHTDVFEGNIMLRPARPDGAGAARDPRAPRRQRARRSPDPPPPSMTPPAPRMVIGRSTRIGPAQVPGGTS